MLHMRRNTREMGSAAYDVRSTLSRKRAKTRGALAANTTVYLGILNQKLGIIAATDPFSLPLMKTPLFVFARILECSHIWFVFVCSSRRFVICDLWRARCRTRFFGARRHIFLAHRDTIFLAHPQCLSTNAHKTLELINPKDYNKPNDAVLIDVEVATRQGDCNWWFTCGEALEV